MNLVQEPVRFSISDAIVLEGNVAAVKSLKGVLNKTNSSLQVSSGDATEFLASEAIELVILIFFVLYF